LPALSLALALWLAVGSAVAAGSPAAGAIPAEAETGRQAGATPTPAGSCAAGRLTIRDLPAIQRDFEAGVARETEKAAEWHDDARLVGLRVGCRLLEPGFNWRGIFFSDAIQTYFYSDTRETKTVDAVAPPGPTLPLDGVSFDGLRRSLIRAGYEDDVQLNPSSNIELRLNSDEAPFGPPEAPRDKVYFHVAIESRGEVIDLFVSAETGTLYQYRPRA
jgi:hypothetical protein